MGRLLVLIAFIFCVLLSVANACSLYVRPLSKFDYAEYIFIGKVSGYTQAPVRSDLTKPFNQIQKDRSVNGVSIALNEGINLPKKAQVHYEVFPYVLYADCSEGSTSLSELRKSYPIGSEVRVIARDPLFVESSKDNGIVRLEVIPGSLSDISLNTDPTGKQITSGSSVFDYKSYSRDDRYRADGYYGLPSFEARKDLLRLERAKTSERSSILDRLAFAPPNANLDFFDVFKAYSLSETEATSRFETQLQRTSPDLFVQYKSYHAALSALMDRGYTREQSEQALKKALASGEEVTPADLIKKAIEILNKKQTP
jgi:hypothetical protein